MKIAMFTNTFSPHVGGVARSVESFAGAYRAKGHEVLIVAPTFAGMPAVEDEVVRLPAVQRFNGSDFSVPVPVPHGLRRRIDAFAPDVVHAHHPFLLGATALRVASARALPAVFTHHTLYERYTHYVPGDSQRMKRFAIELAVGFCNLCDAVIAPSQTVASLLVSRGVETRIEVIPTGIAARRFAHGDGLAFRRRHDLPVDALVVGHVGRLAREKNLPFLAEAIATWAAREHRGRALVCGVGPEAESVRRSFAARGIPERLVLVGHLDADSLADAYAAMDVFAFASQSETQGMVLAEAMTAGVPVVAVDASGVREVVRDGENGRLLACQDQATFVTALDEVVAPSGGDRARQRAAVAETAERFSLDRTAGHALDLYAELIARGGVARRVDDSRWAMAVRRLEEEWKLIKNVATAAGDAFLSSGSDDER